MLSGQLPQLRASSAGAVSDGGADTRCRRRLPTFLAFLRFLSGVGLLMFQEIRAAVEGLFSRVNSLVFSDVRAVPKRLPTPVTLAGLLSGVDALVANVICLVLKEASAFATLIGFLSLKRNESGNRVTVIFKRSIEGVEETLLISRTRVGVLSALWSRSGAPAGPPAPAPPLLLSDVLLHVCVFLWAVSFFRPVGSSIFLCSQERKDHGKPVRAKEQGQATILWPRIPFFVTPFCRKASP